jgi:hypothetical protein
MPQLPAVGITVVVVVVLVEVLVVVEVEVDVEVEVEVDVEVLVEVVVVETVSHMTIWSSGGPSAVEPAWIFAQTVCPPDRFSPLLLTLLTVKEKVFPVQATGNPVSVIPVIVHGAGIQEADATVGTPPVPPAAISMRSLSVPLGC